MLQGIGATPGRLWKLLFDYPIQFWRTNLCPASAETCAEKLGRADEAPLWSSTALERSRRMLELEMLS